MLIIARYLDLICLKLKEIARKKMKKMTTMILRITTKSRRR